MSRVGPVLQAGAAADAVVAALRRLNAGVQTVDRGAYLRASAPRECQVTRQAIEEELGMPFRLPGDLEQIMPSFVGQLDIDEERARWFAAEQEP